MTLSGNYNHVCSGPAAPAQPCHITLQGSDMSRLSLQQGRAMGDPPFSPPHHLLVLVALFCLHLFQLDETILGSEWGR